MDRGKKICKELKAIRQRIADENDIKLEIPECTHQGPCRGTCPRCEGEVRYLERELARRMRLGHNVAMTGLCLSLAACGGNTTPDYYTEGEVDTFPVSDYDDGEMEGVVMTGDPISSYPMEYPAPADPELDDFFAGAYLDPSVKPSFPGGDTALQRYLRENLCFPQEAWDKGIEGKEVVALRINPLGGVECYRIMQDLGGGCAEEAGWLVRHMPVWNPGGITGHGPVSSIYWLTIDFRRPAKRPQMLFDRHVKGHHFDDNDEIFIVTDIDPEFPGGVDSLFAFIHDHIRYPKDALKQGIEGRVYVTFVIEKDGSITSPKLMRDIGCGCGQEALRVVSLMPRWRPAMQRGHTVRCQFNLPVRFTLPEK